MRFPGAAVAQQQNVLAAARSSHRASSSTKVLFRVGMARKSKLPTQILTNALHFLTVPSSECPVSCMQEHFVSGIKRFSVAL
jgi:hypothetical protein